MCGLKRVAMNALAAATFAEYAWKYDEMPTSNYLGVSHVN